MPRTILVSYVRKNPGLFALLGVLAVLALVVVPVVSLSRWQESNRADLWIQAFNEGYLDACSQVFPTGGSVYLGFRSDKVGNASWCISGKPHLFPSDVMDGDYRELFVLGRTKEIGYTLGYEYAVAAVTNSAGDGRLCYRQLDESQCYNREQLLLMHGRDPLG